MKNSTTKNSHSKNLNKLSQRINMAKGVMKKEANSILDFSDRLEESFSKAIDLLSTAEKKIIITGIGKSGHLGKRMAATFSSTGTPAASLQPPEAVHGDFDIHQEKDPVIFLSNSGTTHELIFLEPISVLPVKRKTENSK